MFIFLEMMRRAKREKEGQSNKDASKSTLKMLSFIAGKKRKTKHGVNRAHELDLPTQVHKNYVWACLQSLDTSVE